MEQNLAGLLADAFSDISLPTLADEELDFETLHSDVNFEATTTNSECTESVVSTEQGEAVYQEVTRQPRLFSSILEKDHIYLTENDDEGGAVSMHDEDISINNSVRVEKMDKPPEKHECSDEDPKWDGVDSDNVKEHDAGAGQQAQDWSMDIPCVEEHWDSSNEDNIFAKRQPLPTEDPEHTRVRNTEQGDSENGSQHDGSEKEQEHSRERLVEDSLDSGCEAEHIVPGGRELELHSQRVSHDDGGFCGNADINAVLDFPERSVQNQPYLIPDNIEDDEIVEKVKDFSGDEHQEAGESIADYPSDYSSGEYMGDEESKHKLNALLEQPVEEPVEDLKRGTLEIPLGETDVDVEDRKLNLDTGWTRTHAGASKTGERALANAALEKHDVGCDTCESTYHYVKDKEEERNEARKSAIAVSDEARSPLSHHLDNSDSHTSAGLQPDELHDIYTSSDDDDDDIDIQVRKNKSDFKDEKQDTEHINPPTVCTLIARRSSSEDIAITSTTREQQDLHGLWDGTTGVCFPEEPRLNTNHTDTGGEEPLDVEWNPAEEPSIDINSVQLGNAAHATIHPLQQGSVDDDFFFTSVHDDSDVTEVGPHGDEDCDGERNWEQEQERIKAFYKFYSDSDEENNQEERRIKVHFRMDPLPQVVHYDTEDDVGSLDSSTDGEEGLISAETHQESKEDQTLRMTDLYSCDVLLSSDNVVNSVVSSNTETHTKKHKCSVILFMILKMCLVILMGLLMFWWATDKLDWL